MDIDSYPAEVERFHEEKEVLAGRPAERRGKPHHVGLQTVRPRSGTEEIPEPWAELSLRVALGVAGLELDGEDPDDERQLLVGVTETDPQ
ncbi:hypothetical protein SAMN04487983_1002111 [Streptomyces sp. yr375]|uniref:hypothetical protein n=1 Tax=Streptomyces sp. yr375 TaxID=1761906 RepID=UPI0008AC85D1|nr:hypothetical protein [Streptomyces sp. yr375]SEP89455.1 hypothetical protein SAMN04487983_1002111 [Streptomyces sp. yr375]